MRSDWTEMGSNPAAGLLVKKKKEAFGQPGEQGHVVMETDCRDTAPKAKEGEGWPRTTRNRLGQGRSLH